VDLTSDIISDTNHIGMI